VQKERELTPSDSVHQGCTSAQTTHARRRYRHPLVEAFGRKATSLIVNSDRGGAISILTQDPLVAREGERP
jgi:hypothetical protein